MRRTALILAMLAIAGGAAFAQKGTVDDPFARFGDGPYLNEARAIMDEREDRVPAQLTFGEMEELAGELSIPAQKAAYVRKSRLSSMVMPGTGQFLNDDPVAGALFVTGDLAITTGTLVGVYFLLPEEVRLDRLDYLDSSNAQVKDTWETALGDMTLGRSLSIAGVLTGGMLLDSALGYFSSRHAGKLARMRIEAGDVEFEARPEILFGAGMFRFGMRMRY
ncbi:MAG: hypothetical protein ACOC2D_17835 [Spirochaetota bacterium]